MTKYRKLLLYLAAMALMVLLLWCMLEFPRFTAESAFHLVERRELRAEGDYLGSYYLMDVYGPVRRANARGKQRRYVAVGKTDTHLRLTQLTKLDLRWYSSEHLITVPLEGDLTVEFEPWGSEFQDVAIFVCTELDYDHGVAVLTIGETPYDASFSADPSGFVHVPFEPLSGVVADELQEQAILRQYDLRGIGYDENLKTHDVTLEVVLYDSQNEEVARTVKEYPASQ